MTKLEFTAKNKELIELHIEWRNAIEANVHNELLAPKLEQIRALTEELSYAKIV